jgi:hypothetical protein
MSARRSEVFSMKLNVMMNGKLDEFDGDERYLKPPDPILCDTLLCPLLVSLQSSLF